MSRFSNPKAAQAMMATHGHTNIGMPPKPGFPGTPGPAFVNPIRPGGPIVSQTVGPRNVPQQSGGPKIGSVGMTQELPSGIKKSFGAPPPGQRAMTGAQSGATRGGNSGGKVLMKKGGAVKKSASAKTSSRTMASRRGDGIAVRGKTKGGIR